MRRSAILMALALVLACGATACDPTPTVGAWGGTGQITARSEPGALLGLYDRRGRVVPTLVLPATGDPVPRDFRRTDSSGVLVMRYVTPGSGYTVRRVDGNGTRPSGPVSVTPLLATPSSSLYTSQHLADGFGYLLTRDGTLLSVMVRLPGPPEKGPYPTVVEYSGYAPSSPEFDRTTAASRIASALGYATVGVNIRGTGCSGGSFELWEDAQATDGYDAVETVAAQPWALDHRVGMVGLSYPGIAQLYTAATQPPHLASIAVSGSYDDGFRNLLRPSGIVNSGFAKSWVQGRYDESQPEGQAWVKEQVDSGDAICAFNQTFRQQNLDITSRIDTEKYFPTILGLGDTFAPATFVDRIKVPVFLSSSWQDEQTGGHTATMIPNFTGTSRKHFLFTNGGHAEVFASPDLLARWAEFLDLYVRRRTPDLSLVQLIAPYVNQQVVGSKDQLTSLPFPANRFAGMSYPQALASYEAEPPFRVLFDNGAGADGVAPGLPHTSFARDFGAYPVPGTQVSRWYLAPGATLTPGAPTAGDGTARSSDTYVSDPAVRPRGSLTKGGEWGQFPEFDWAQPVTGKSLTYVSPPLATDTTMIGSGSVDLWLRSSDADTDLQATLTEVRPDGKETYVQSGWVRTTVRKVDEARSTELQPLLTMLAGDAAPMPAGQFAKVRVEIYPFAHVFRAGSRFRLIITAPGGDRVAWEFDTLPGTQTNEVARSVGRPSSIALPVVSGGTVPTGLPACPGLRAQPCRSFVPATNGG